MGFYRLLLAFCVVYSHVSGEIHHYNIGAAAVISFYLLSGFFMTALIGRYYLAVKFIPYFYVDRLARLLPQFLLYTLLTLVAAKWLDLRHPWMPEMPSAIDVAKQFSLFLLNFYRDYPNMLLPQAWSLGLESFFYLTFPLVLIFRLRPVVAIISIFIYLRSYLNTLDTDLYGYRYLPGTYFIFIAGSYIQTLDRKKASVLAAVVSVCALLLLLVTYLKPALNLPYIRSVLSGLAVGVLIVSQLVGVEGFKKLDQLAGDISYGVFLNHVLILGCVETFFSFAASALSNPVLFLAICGASSVLAYLTFAFVEKPLIALRRGLRHPAAVQRTPLGPRTDQAKV